MPRSHDLEVVCALFDEDVLVLDVANLSLHVAHLL